MLSSRPATFTDAANTIMRSSGIFIKRALHTRPSLLDALGGIRMPRPEATGWCGARQQVGTECANRLAWWEAYCWGRVRQPAGTLGTNLLGPKGGIRMPPSAASGGAQRTHDVSPLPCLELGADGCQYLAVVLQIRMTNLLIKLHSAAHVWLRLA